MLATVQTYVPQPFLSALTSRCGRAEVRAPQPVGCMHGLDGGENPPANSWRELNEGEETRGVEIVLSRFVNHAELPVSLGVSIRNDLIELAALQGGHTAPILETQDELAWTSCHINQDNA